MNEVDTLKTENEALRRQVLQETIRRLSMEHQALQSTLSFVQIRGPQVDQELELVKKKLSELTGEAK